MSKPDAHEMSLMTRRSIQTVVDYWIPSDDKIAKIRLLNRAVHGFINAYDGHVRRVWPKNLPSEDADKCYYLYEVAPQRAIPKTAPDSRHRWDFAYEVVAYYKGDGNGNFVLESVGEEHTFDIAGVPKKISGHSCKDTVYNIGFKSIQTACFHDFEVTSFSPPELNQIAMAAGAPLKFSGNYEIRDGLVELYNELYKHKLKSWQRLNLLYAEYYGKLADWKKGRNFRKSVDKYLDPILFHRDDRLS
ncbi:MAG: hypothetical protein V1887_00415 [Candidatus Aenigmatarchaeota archaeon]